LKPSKKFEIDFTTYEKLHKKKEIRTRKRFVAQKNEWILDRIEKENPGLTWVSYYKWVE
jgi:hypothetical protein